VHVVVEPRGLRRDQLRGFERGGVARAALRRDGFGQAADGGDGLPELVV